MPAMVPKREINAETGALPAGPGVGHVALIGLMGAGKTTVGRILAADIGWPFVDTDAQIEALTGRTVRELWSEGGEAAYRQLESDAVVTALSATEPSVLAAPGGVVDDDVAAAAVRATGVAAVYLRAQVVTLVERVGRNPGHRPLLGARPEELIGQLFARRDRAYRRLADVTVDVDGLGPADVFRTVRGALGALGRSDRSGATAPPQAADGRPDDV
jgi:shikimate kinase